MQISGHKTRSIFDRYNIVNERDIVEATSKMEQRFQTAISTLLAHQQESADTPNRSDSSQLIDFIEWVWLRGEDLNLRPLGYEPNELPDCSTPHNHPIACQPSGQILVT